MSTEAPGAQRADACPDPEQLAAYIDAGLPPDERTLVERHLVTCPDCRDIIGGSVEALEEIRSNVLPFRVKWVAVGTGLAAAAAAALVLIVRVSDPGDPFEELRAAAGRTRAIEPRLSGGSLPYRPLEPVTRSGAQPEVPPELRIAEASLQKRTEASRSAENLHALSAAQLLARAIEPAIRSLEDAGELDPASRQIQFDLAAAYVARGQRQHDADAFRRALAILDRAGGTQPPEALFNRALALEGLERRDEAIAAWTAYLNADATSPWAAEAQDHRARLRQS